MSEAAREANVSRIRRIAALGSSFAAGPGVEPMADASAQRSARNYPHQLAERIGAELVDLTVAGATTSNLIDTPQQADDGTVFEPQTEGVPVDADLVTITAGGNDLLFLPRIIWLGLSRLKPDAEFVVAHADQFGGEITPSGTDEIARVTSGLIAVVDRARARAPAARILLVDYLTVVAPYSATGTPFTDTEVDAFSVIQDDVRRVFRDAAAQTGVELVLASAISEDHALGSAEPWLQPLATPASLHPTEAGMGAVAAEIERRLGVAPEPVHVPDTPETRMTDSSPHERLALAVVDLIREDRFDELQHRFVPMLHGVISESGLRDAWRDKLTRYGALQTAATPVVSPTSQGMMLARVELGFERGTAVLVISMLDGRLVNLAFEEPATP